MKVKYTINAADYWNFNKYFILKTPSIRRNYILSLAAVPVLVLVGLLFIRTFYEMSLMFVIIFSIVGGAVGDLFLIHTTRIQIMRIPNNNPGVLGEHAIEINEKGVRETTAVNDGFQSWEGIQNIEQDKDYIYIFLGSMLAHIIPKRAFSSPEAASAFYNQSVDFWKKTRSA